MHLQSFILIIGAYLLGSIPVGLLLCSWKYKIDVREFGSGNIGATNVGRVIGKKIDKKTGKKAKNYVLSVDVFKGFLPVFIAVVFMNASQTVTVLVAGAAMLGHCFSIYLRFKGGKGVATGLGVTIVLLALWAAIPVITYVAVSKKTEVVSKGSLTASGISVPVAIITHQPIEYIIFFLFSLTLITFTHRSNIRRWREGTENLIGE